MRLISVADFLTEAEIAEALSLWPTHGESGTFAATVAQTIITPNLSRINAALGQENDARYLAYMVEYVIRQAMRREDACE